MSSSMTTASAFVRLRFFEPVLDVLERHRMDDGVDAEHDDRLPRADAALGGLVAREQERAGERRGDGQGGDRCVANGGRHWTSGHPSTAGGSGLLNTLSASWS